VPSRVSGTDTKLDSGAPSWAALPCSGTDSVAPSAECSGTASSAVGSGLAGVDSTCSETDAAILVAPFVSFVTANRLWRYFSELRILFVAV